MYTLFRWFYCLPIWDAVLLILFVTAAFLFLRQVLGKAAYWKVSVILLFLVWIATILLGTLGQRSAGTLLEPVLMPFASYYAAHNGGSNEIYRTNFMNVVLFFPAGLLGYEVLPNLRRKCWRIILVTCLFALISIGIEYIQYCFGLGLAETDDIIHNTLGAFLGAIVCSFSIRIPKE